MRTSARTPSYMPQLDGLRGCAVILVLLAHGSTTVDAPWLAPLWHAIQALRTGYVGVDLFFALSGFLITRLLLAERMREGRINLLNFYIRRTVRIFPIYYLAVVLVTLTWPSPPALSSSLFFYAFNYYLPFHETPYPLEHTWSLAVEEQFYLLWPALVAFLPWQRLATATAIVFPLCALAIAILFAALLPPTLAGALIYNSLPTRMFSLLLGAYLAVREANGTPVRFRSAGLLAVAGAAVLVGTFVGRAVHVLPAGGWYWCWALIGYGLFAVGVVGSVAAPDSPATVQGPLTSAPLRFIGRISYGLYLYHLPLFFYLGINPAAVADDGVRALPLAVGYALSFALAIASYFLIEQPLLRNRSKIALLLSAHRSLERPS